MAATRELLWRLVPGIRRGERSRFLFFAGVFTLVSIAETLGFIGSEALFLSDVGVDMLPLAFVAAAILTVVGTLVYAARVGVSRNDDIYVAMLVGTSVLLAAGTAAAATGWAPALAFLFCLYYVTFAIFVNHFWTFSGDYFDTLATKRLFPLFTIGASVGGAAGGALALVLTRTLGPTSLIAAWATFLAAAAIVLRLGRRRLRRWGPLDLEEADETSVESMQGSVRYLRTSPLGRWLMLSALGMVLALFISQYLYSDIFARHFVTSDRLASFFAVYQGVTNVVEIVIELAVTPFLIRRFGVASSNLVHPILTLITFAGLARWYTVSMALVARINRELVENATAGPLRSLVYNAIPVRFRGRLRAFLEGVVVYAGMAVAGIVLLAVGEPDPRMLAWSGGAVAFLYLVANLRTRREYLRSLVDELREGRLDLDAVGDEIGRFEASRLARLWEDMLRAEGGRPSDSLLQLIPKLASRGIIAPLVREATHPHPDVRRACLHALAGVPGRAARDALLGALGDAAAPVRLSAIRGLERHGTETAIYEARLRALLADASPEVRVEAARALGAEGVAVILEMAGSSDPTVATAALRSAAPDLRAVARSRARDVEPTVRAAALEALAQLGDVADLDLDEIRRALEDPDAGVRRAAVYVLANLDGDDARSALADALGDRSPEVRFAAETVIGSLGDEGVDLARTRLRSGSDRIVESAIRIVARSGGGAGRNILSEELRYRVRGLWRDIVAYQHLPAPIGVPGTFLRCAYEDGMMRHRRLAFRILEAIENRSIVRSVEKVMRFGGARSRGDALEVLSNLGDRESAELLTLVHDSGDLADKIERVRSIVDVTEDPEGVSRDARESERRWIHMAANAVDATSGGMIPEERLMDRLLVLKNVPLFAELSLEQLEALNQIARETEFVRGEVILREGDPGGLLYILLEGSVRVVKNRGEPNERLLSVVDAIDYFGEMAILDDEPRSATVVTDSPARLLSLDGASFKDLILQMPEISFEIFRVLTGRIRAADARLSQR